MRFVDHFLLGPEESQSRCKLVTFQTGPGEYLAVLVINFYLVPGCLVITEHSFLTRSWGISFRVFGDQ